jgi:hypothetical protein
VIEEMELPAGFDEDLERIMATYRPRGVWTPEQIALLRRYHKRVPAAALVAPYQEQRQRVGRVAANHAACLISIAQIVGM